LKSATPRVWLAVRDDEFAKNPPSATAAFLASGVLCLAGMKLSVRLRMIEFLIAVTVVVAAIVFTERSAWQQFSRLRKELQPERIKQFRTADELCAAVLEVHEAWHRASENADSTNRALMEAASDNLEKLIRDRLTHTGSVAEREQIDSLAEESKKYLALVTNLLRAPAVGVKNAQFQRQEWEIEAGLARFLKLCEKLTEANESAAQDFFARGEGSFDAVATIPAIPLCVTALLARLGRLDHGLGLPPVGGPASQRPRRNPNHHGTSGEAGLPGRICSRDCP